MAPRRNTQNRQTVNQRANQRNNRMPSRAITQAAPQVQQAPYPEAFAKNPPKVPAQYIPNLMVPGNEGYRPEYGGGGWVAGVSDYNGPGYNSVNDIKDWYKAMAATGGAALGSGSWDDIRAAAATYDPSKFGASSTASSPATSSQKSYKGIGSINAGLKIGGDNILGKREAGRIARNTGKSYDDVITKALGRGMSIGGGAVRKSNRAAGGSQVIPTIKGQQMFTSGGSDDPLSAMRRVTPGKRQMYSGTYQLDGETMPLIESRRGGVASNLGGMTAGGGRRRGGKGKGRGRRGRGGAGDMGGADMGTMPQTSMADYIPPAMDEPLPEQDININMPGVGEDVFSSATGFRSKRSSRKRAGRQAAGLASQRINPTGSWIYRI